MQMLHQRLLGPVGPTSTTNRRCTEEFRKQIYGLHGEQVDVGTRGKYSCLPHVSTTCGQGQSTDQYVATLTKNIQAALNAARAQRKTSLKRMKRDYDVRTLQRFYNKGDVVYLLDTAVLKGKCRKLSSPWKGPAVMVEKISASLYRVQLRKFMFVVNHDRMKFCRDRELPDWVTKWTVLMQIWPLMMMSSQSTVFCRKPWQGRFMIQCDGCDEWGGGGGGD